MIKLNLLSEKKSKIRLYYRLLMMSQFQHFLVNFLVKPSIRYNFWFIHIFYHNIEQISI